MAIERHILRYALLTTTQYTNFTRVEGHGTYTGIIDGLWPLPLRFEQRCTELDAAQQSNFDAIVSFCTSYLTAEERPEGYAGHVIWRFDITTNDAGDTPTGVTTAAPQGEGTYQETNPGAYVNLDVRTSTPGFDTRAMSGWTKPLSAFTASEQATLQDFVTAMHGLFVARWPLPPWPG